MIAVGVKPKLAAQKTSDSEPEAKPETSPEIIFEIKPEKIKPTSKQDTVLNLLKRPGGATLDDLTEATQWQKHSVRGFLSHAVKKRLRIRLLSEKLKEGERRYRVETDKTSQSPSLDEKD